MTPSEIEKVVGRWQLHCGIGLSRPAVEHLVSLFSYHFNLKNKTIAELRLAIDPLVRMKMLGTIVVSDDEVLRAIAIAEIIDGKLIEQELLKS